MTVGHHQLMRTSKDECVQIGKFMVRQWKDHTKDSAHVVVLLPGNDVSIISEKGQDFDD